MKRNIIRTIVGLGLLLALTSSPAPAAKVKVWQHNEPAQFENAQFHKAVISDHGVIRLARELKQLADVKSLHVWDLIEDKNGNLFVATGVEGKLFKLSPEGKLTLVYTSKDGQILSLAAAADGTIYAGTGPSGSLVRIPLKGKPHVVVEKLDSYVWCLALDQDTGTVYAGTGPKGKIYQVTPDGKATVFYATKQNHVLCLARSMGKMLYAGTDKGGMVYRIDPKGKGFVLYSAPQAEVRSLLVTAKGVYAGTSSPSSNYKSQAVVNATGEYTPLKKGQLLPASGKKEAPAKAIDDVKVAAKETSSEAEESQHDQAKGAPSAGGPGSGENSLYRIAPDGTVCELFREKAMILSLIRQHGNMLIGTGMKGQLFEINEQTKERTEIARLDHGQIHCMLQRRDGSIVLGTGDPGKIYVLGKHHVQQGTVTSDVLDAKLISKWGAAAWRAKTPAGTSVTVAFRSGNVPDPDETWSDWTDEQSDGDAAKIGCPTARFLQYRVTLKTKDAAKTPSLNSLTLRYMTTNHAPEVSKIEVPDLDGTDLEKPEKVRIKWRATDPNEDELTYSVYLRKEGWESWICLKDDLGKREFQWDATALPSGLYRVKVVASDQKDNTTADALQGEAISKPFPISNLPPKVTMNVVAVEGGKAILEATANDPMIRICHASYSLDGKAWVNVFPQDGLFDSKHETFRFTTPSLTPGHHVLVLRARNAAGHVGTADAVVVIPSALAPANAGE
jgi:hypothetical protein